MKFLSLIFLLLFTSNFLAGQKIPLNDLKSIEIGESVEFYQLVADSFFNSPQIISIIEFQNEAYSHYEIKLVFRKTGLERTSSFAEKYNAIAAINGGFFDIFRGGSVNYFEVSDSVIHTTRGRNGKWEKPSGSMNGAVVLTKSKLLDIQPAESDGFYEHSGNESGVMVTGPLLIINSKLLKLNSEPLVNKRHPRTCLCETKESLLLITIDGRKSNASGMTLLEVQSLLSGLSCTDAINLDGGGSTTLWIWNKEIVNQPSDPTGERPVANAIVVVEKQE